jgi:hypothetical protein
MTNTLTYRGPVSKAVFVEEMQWHLEADAFVQGTYGGYEYGSVFRGCAVGCAIESINKRLGTRHNNNDHDGMAAALGWPRWLAELADRVFEGLDDEACKRWPLELATAVPEGADLEPLKYPLMARLLEQLGEGRALRSDIKQLLDDSIALFSSAQPDEVAFDELSRVYYCLDETNIIDESDDDVVWGRFDGIFPFILDNARPDDCIAGGHESCWLASRLILEEIAKA